MKNSQIHIGVDCRLFSSKFTGIGRYTHEIVNYLIANHKGKITLFFNDPEYSKFKITKPNVQKILVNSPHYSFAEQTKFLIALNKANADIVHFPHFNIPIFYNKPYIVTIHDLILSFFPGNKMTRFYHRWAYQIVLKNSVIKAKKIISVSNSTKEDIKKHLKIKASKIKTIYNGVSDSFFPVKSQSALDKTLKKYKIKTPFLLYTGVWRSHKNLPRLIEALQILKNKNLDLSLVITGKPDPHYPEVLNTIKNLNLKNDITLTGLVGESELNHLYNAAKIYTFPSLYEGFGLPPLEAMKCLTPVVASNVSSIPEICNGNAILFNPYSPQDIADKIELLYKDTDLQADLIGRSKQYAEKFTWQKTAEETYKLLCSYHSKN